MRAIKYGLFFVVPCLTFLYLVQLVHRENEPCFDDATIYRPRPLEALVVSNCTMENIYQDVVPILEQCRIDCGSRCQYCGQVYAFCTEGGLLVDNFTQNACNVAFLDYIPVSPFCPFSTSLEKCCNSTLPVPPLEPVGLECDDQTNLDLVYERLVFCQQDCGSRCTICGQVWNYCKQIDSLERSLNYTVEACTILTLDSIPTSNGLCPFNITLEECCFESPTPLPLPPSEPPVAPPVQPPIPVPVYDCTDQEEIQILLAICQVDCGFDCFLCSEVYDFCIQQGRFTANSTLTDCTENILSGSTTNTGCPFQVAIISCCTPIEPPVTPPIEPPVQSPIAPPIAPPPPTPDNTAVCSFGFYQNAYSCMVNQSLGANCTERTATCQGLLLTLGNDTESDQCILFNLGGSEESLGDCDFVSSVDACCGTLPASNITCTTQANCPVDYVCTANPGTCSGIQGAPCDANRLCSNAYDCSGGICTNSAPDSFQSAVVNQCTSAPILECNTTASIALRESNNVGAPLSCNNPNTAYLSSSLVAYFYLPATNASFDSFNNTFTLYSPSPVSFTVRVLLPCGANFCDGELTRVVLPSGIISYNDIVDYDAQGVVRGYALIVPGSLAGTQLPPLNGIIVNVTTQCLRDVPVPPSPGPIPIGPPVPPQPPTPCKDDAQCECSFCCESSDCVLCPIRCTQQPCPQGLFCTPQGYCTTNRICEAFDWMRWW